MTDWWNSEYKVNTVKGILHNVYVIFLKINTTNENSHFMITNVIWYNFIINICLLKIICIVRKHIFI